MTFAEFVEQVADFGNRFFSAMDEQVQTAVSKNWGNIQLGKTPLIGEQQERKAQFNQDLTRLKKKPVE